MDPELDPGGSKISGSGLQHCPKLNLASERDPAPDPHNEKSIILMQKILGFGQFH
jgi:hypothetical protein